MGKRAAAIVGLTEWAPKRVWDEPMFTMEACARLAAEVLADAEVDKGEVDGLVINGLRESPLFAPSALAEFLGVRSNFNEVVDLGGQPPIVQSASSLNRQFHVEGFPLGAKFYKRVVSATLDGSSGRNVATNVMCEGGEVAEGTNFSEGGGAPVPCAGAPEVYWGQPIPNIEGGVYTNVRIGQNLSLYALVDYVGGHTLSLGDVSAQHRFFLNSRAILERTDEILLGYEALGADGLAQSGVVDGDFIKLRTVSASYTLPESWAQQMWASRVSLTASIDNALTMWQKSKESFGHPIMDIERARQSPGQFGLNSYVQEGWPQITRFVSTLRFTF